ncbi:MAG: hypothetical protein RJQ09_15110 [Cyclobacteriaceae bacterium]
MLESIVTVVFEFLFYVILSYPGAFIRWVFTKGKSFDEIHQDNMLWNGVIGAILLTCIVLVVVYINKDSDIIDDFKSEPVEISALRQEIQSKIDLAENFYVKAIADIHNGIDIATIKKKYRTPIDSLFDLVNADLIKLATVCKKKGMNQEEYDLIFHKINYKDVSRKSEQLKKLGIEFKLTD